MLVSGTVFGTVVGGPFEFEDRGFHELKGVPGRWPLFALGVSSPAPAAAPHGAAHSSGEAKGPAREPVDSVP